MNSQAEAIIRETFQKLGDAIGVRIDIPDETIADLAATLQNIAAVEAESFEFLNELALAFRAAESHPRPAYAPVLEGVRAVLAHLQSAGRLIPAELAGDLRIVLDNFGRHSITSDMTIAAERLHRARFPATEPAEGGLGDVDPLDPQGRTYRETGDQPLFEPFPAPAEPAEEETKAEYYCCHPKCRSTDWGGSNRKHERGADCPIVPKPASSPVAEETKAVTFDEIAQSLKSIGDAESSFGFNLRFWRRITEKLIAKYPHILSSPVVPAPTETEWPTVEEIPVGAAFRPAGYTGPSCIIKTELGYRITTNGDHRLWNGAPVGTLAPFVAAEGN